MGIKIEFSTQNAAFADGNEHAESARILAELAAKLRNGIGRDDDNGPLRDGNGNRVGYWYFESEQESDIAPDAQDDDDDDTTTTARRPDAAAD